MASKRRLIDANALLERENEAYLIARQHPSGAAIFAIIHRTLQDLLKQAPTVDAVEVVRCKDCVSYNGEGCLKTYGEFEPDPMHFCAYGERRDNG